MKRTFLTSIALCVLAVGSYVAAASSGTAWDLTEEGSATLSPTTLRVLERVDRRLHLTAFFPRGAPGRVEASTVLARYRDANRKITFDIVDPTTYPGEAQRLGVEEIGNTAVEDLSSEDVEIAQFAIEIDLTSAIARLLREVEGEVCFTRGHAEREVGEEGPAGLSTAASILEANGYTISSPDLLTATSIPDGCDVVVVAGADTAFREDVIDELSGFTSDAGKLLVLHDPGASASMAEVLEPYGIVPLGGTVVEGDDGSHLEGDLLAPIVTRYAGGSSIVRGLGPTFFPRVSGYEVELGDDAGLTTTALASTSEISYLDREDAGSFDPEVDVEGPVTIGASADASEVADDGSIVRTRVVVWGDVDFATNGFIRDGDNASLFLQAVDWLAQPEDLVGAVPNFPKVRELDFTAARSRYTLYLLAGVVPGLWLIAGMLVWVLRRRR